MTLKSRDPRRIEVMLDTIRRIWEQDPDLRLGQLIINAMTRARMQEKRLFFLEDKELFKALKEFAEFATAWRRMREGPS